MKSRDPEFIPLSGGIMVKHLGRPRVCHLLSDKLEGAEGPGAGSAFEGKGRPRVIGRLRVWDYGFLSLADFSPTT